MKKIMNWVLAAIVICGAMSFASCNSYDIPVINPVTPPEPSGKLVTLPPGVVSKGYTMQTKKTVNTATGEREFYDMQNVQVAFNGKDVYVAGFSSSFPESFIKGTLTDAGTCLFKSGQYVGEDKDGEKYVIGMNTGTLAASPAEGGVTDLEFSYDAEMRILTLVAADGASAPTPAIAESGDPLTPSLASSVPVIRSATVMPGSFKEQPMVTLPEGVTTEQWYITGANKNDNNLNYGVTIGFNGQDVYIQGLFQPLPLTWVKGRLSDGVITIDRGQFLGYYKEWQEVFLVGGKGEEVDDLTLTYDTEKGVMESDNSIAMYALDTQTYPYYFYDAYIAKERYVLPDPILPPDGIAASAYRFDYELMALDEDGIWMEKIEDGMDEVLLCFDGNDVYFKFTFVLANGWAKGTLSSDGQTITIPSLQYVGSWQGNLAREDYYLTGFVEKGPKKYELTDIVLNYDAQQGVISSSQMIGFSSSYRTYSPYGYLEFQNMVFTKKKEVAATPAAPEITMTNGEITSYVTINLGISLVAVDGADLLTDKLNYIIYYEKDGQEHELVFRAADYKELKEDMVEIPYNLANIDFVRGGETIIISKSMDGFFTWTKVGAKVIYRGGGEVHASPITWFDAKSFFEEEGLLK